MREQPPRACKRPRTDSPAENCSVAPPRSKRARKAFKEPPVKERPPRGGKSTEANSPVVECSVAPPRSKQARSMLKKTHKNKQTPGALKHPRIESLAEVESSVVPPRSRQARKAYQGSVKQVQPPRACKRPRSDSTDQRRSPLAPPNKRRKTTPEKAQPGPLIKVRRVILLLPKTPERFKSAPAQLPAKRDDGRKPLFPVRQTSAIRPSPPSPSPPKAEQKQHPEVPIPMPIPAVLEGDFNLYSMSLGFLVKAFRGTLGNPDLSQQYKSLHDTILHFQSISDWTASMRISPDHGVFDHVGADPDPRYPNPPIPINMSHFEFQPELSFNQFQRLHLVQDTGIGSLPGFKAKLKLHPLSVKDPRRKHLKSSVGYVKFRKVWEGKSDKKPGKCELFEGFVTFKVLFTDNYRQQGLGPGRQFTYAFWAVRSAKSRTVCD